MVLSRFKKKRITPTPSAKTDDEKDIEREGHNAIRESRRQITRAKNILEDEISRIDRVLERKIDE